MANLSMITIIVSNAEMTLKKKDVVKSDDTSYNIFYSTHLLLLFLMLFRQFYMKAINSAAAFHPNFSSIPRYDGLRNG